MLAETEESATVERYSSFKTSKLSALCNENKNIEIHIEEKVKTLSFLSRYKHIRNIFFKEYIVNNWISN